MLRAPGARFVAVLAAALPLALAGGARAQSSAPVEVEPRIVDFGDLKPGEIAEREVTLTNTGDAALVIRSARSSCDCTSAALTQREIAPGESVPVIVAYEADEKTGPFNRTIAVRFDGFGRPTTIGVKVDVNYGIRVRVIPGPGGEPERAQLVSSDGEPFRVLRVGPQVIGGPPATERSVDLLEGAQPWPLSTRWFIIETDRPGAPVLAVSRKDPRARAARSARSWTLSPDHAVLGELTAGRQRTVEVELLGVRGDAYDAIERLVIETHQCRAGLLGITQSPLGMKAKFFVLPEPEARGFVGATVRISVGGQWQALDLMGSAVAP